MHKKVVSMVAHKALRLAWIKRRARMLQRAFAADLVTAQLEATVDWYRFRGKALPYSVARRVQAMKVEA